MGRRPSIRTPYESRRADPPAGHEESYCRDARFPLSTFSALITSYAGYMSRYQVYIHTCKYIQQQQPPSNPVRGLVTLYTCARDQVPTTPNHQKDWRTVLDSAAIRLYSCLLYTRWIVCGYMESETTAGEPVGTGTCPS
ncbi:unnamed protein product [Periconia digitata]|uniref:Uncharacterized protein n=1 Tax=Periconia digitata TaxID=1303443 RepID=A0A9W4XSN1_9PLEO|nr:unnamed protein product [Periconia digitata]